MAGENIVQGAVTDVIIQPTWGTVEGNVDKPKDEENQLNFADILAQLQIYFDRKSDKNHTHDDRYYLKTDVDALLEDYYVKTDIDTLLDNKLDISNWKSSNNIGYILSGTSDVTKANNNISSNIYASACTINDSENHLVTRYETEICTDGKVKSIWYLRNYNTSGGTVGSAGLQMIMDKSGTLTWNVGAAANFRSAIDAAPSSHTHDDRYYTETEINTKLSGKSDTSHTHNYIVSRGNVTAETGANRPTVSGLSMSEAYSNGYPTNYGNVITLKGRGDGQIFVGWSGASGTRASTYLRSRRDVADADWSSWFEILDSGNYSSYAAPASHTHAYLPTAGGTMSGALNFANNTWNKMGDDCQLGDTNVGGCFSIKGLNNTTGINFIQYKATAAGTLKWDGTNFITSAPILNNNGGSWIQARNFANIKITGYAGGQVFYPLTASKTNTGCWCLGSNAGTDDSFVFSFTTDANFNANSNVHTPVYLLKPTSTKYFIIGTWGTTAMTDGSSALQNGTVYFQY